ncbi:MAG: NYN domain-containing protein [Desulfobacterales bacterium]|nr:NYN domain-containing protein [Desulfobacterales bacterium]
MELLALVDFNNIAPILQNRGLTYISERVIDRLQFDEINSYRRIKLRLYDGWYNQNIPTRKAQQIQTDIQQNFPRRMNVTDNGRSHSLIIIIEMAMTLINDPHNHLFSTYRPRGMPTGLRCHHPNSLGCTNSLCPLIDVHDFINNGVSNTQCCSITSQDMIYRGEQKLVDTMVICDLLYLASDNDYHSVIIVSSDDDFWPGIKSAIVLGTNIIHIHTRNRSTPQYYSGNLRQTNYSQRIM